MLDREEALYNRKKDVKIMARVSLQPISKTDCFAIHYAMIKSKLRN